MDEGQIIIIPISKPGRGWEVFPDEINQYSGTTVITPMTTSSIKYPTRIKVKHDNKIGWIVLDQIRTVDRQRIIKVFGEL